MISRLLVPVDLSPASESALRYAEGIADHLGLDKIRIIHVFTPQTASSEAITVSPVGELMEEREQALLRFVSDLPATPGVRRVPELLLGFAADKIISESADHDLVVLGSNGETDLLEEVFGSVASAVAQRSQCPVLMVPRQAVFTDYRHILYASNSLSLSRRAVLQLMDFNELFHARVHFVHVNDDDSEHKTEREKLFAPLFNNPNPEFAFEIVEVTADSVQEGLVSYLDKNPVQLAVMVTKHRGFWERLFHHSETKQMLLNPVTPLLVFHLEPHP